MAQATIDGIDAAIVTQLNTLLTTASPAGPLVTVERYAGEIVRNQNPGVQILSRTPAALLALEGEQYAADDRVETLRLGTVAFVGRSTWRVYVVASELRGHDEAVKGSSTTGLYSLLTQVVSKLAGLVIPGLYQTNRLEILDIRPHFIKPGSYIYLVRVAADREISAVTPAVTTNPLTIQADLNLTPSQGDPIPAAANPLARITTP